MKAAFTSIILVSLALAAGCQSPYYKAMEKVGIHKREILVDRVKEGKESQQEAKEQIQTAMERFVELTQFDGGDLEKIYNRLNRELGRSKEKASEIKKRIHDIEDVSKELFREWEQELKQFQNPEYRRISEEQLEATYSRYEDLIRAMKKAEQSIQPVLVTFNDQVLFLKHNLNAQAIASLDTQTERLQSDIAVLVAEMEASIAEADAFIESMNQI